MEEYDGDFNISKMKKAESPILKSFYNSIQLYMSTALEVFFKNKSFKMFKLIEGLTLNV
jgi:hypothetical protein